MAAVGSGGHHPYTAGPARAWGKHFRLDQMPSHSLAAYAWPRPAGWCQSRAGGLALGGWWSAQMTSPTHPFVLVKHQAWLPPRNSGKCSRGQPATSNVLIPKSPVLVLQKTGSHHTGRDQICAKESKAFCMPQAGSSDGGSGGCQKLLLPAHPKTSQVEAHLMPFLGTGILSPGAQLALLVPSRLQLSLLWGGAVGRQDIWVQRLN